LLLLAYHFKQSQYKYYEYDNPKYITQSQPIISNHTAGGKTTSKLCEDAKEVVACLSPTRCEEALVFNQENPEKHFQNKATETKGQISLLFDQQITTENHGTRPMPN